MTTLVRLKESKYQVFSQNVFLRKCRPCFFKEKTKTVQFCAAYVCSIT